MINIINYENISDLFSQIKNLYEKYELGNYLIIDKDFNRLIFFNYENDLIELFDYIDDFNFNNLNISEFFNSGFKHFLNFNEIYEYINKTYNVKEIINYELDTLIKLLKEEFNYE